MMLVSATCLAPIRGTGKDGEQELDVANLSDWDYRSTLKTKTGYDDDSKKNYG